MRKTSDQKTQSVEFTQAQFFALLKTVYLGNWLANAHRDGSAKNPHKEEYEAIEDLLFSQAKKFGLDEYVDDEDAAQGKFFPTRKFEEETDVDDLHAEYDDATFWDELVDRLGTRDFHRLFTEAEISKMSDRDRIEKFYACTDKWEDETHTNGVERLEIKK